MAAGLALVAQADETLVDELQSQLITGARALFDLSELPRSPENHQAMEALLRRFNIDFASMGRELGGGC